MYVLLTDVLKEINGVSSAQTTNSVATAGVYQRISESMSFISGFINVLSHEKPKTTHRGSKMIFYIIMVRALFQQHNVFMGTKITFYLSPQVVLLPAHKSEQSAKFVD
jgi:hypothetical protein